MAKQRHRIFEIYEHQDEAIRALTPKSAKTNEVEASDPLPANFNHLTVSRSSVVTHVQFKGTMEFAEEAERELRDDFSRLAGLLDIDSKVLLDFTDVNSFSPACVDALVVFVRTLRNRGSRAVLCSLAPNVRASFYAAR
ncbi:MAG: STAS domain-containing protein [Planctomycetota bacterium]